MQTITLNIEGMTCGGCARSVTKAIQSVDAAAQVTVDIPTHTVQVQTTAPQAAVVAAARKSLVGSGDRSERIRTYNWPENRISDHRINYKSNNLDSVLDGNMDDLIGALQTHERQERLEAE